MKKIKDELKWHTHTHTHIHTPIYLTARRETDEQKKQEPYRKGIRQRKGKQANDRQNYITR